MQWHPEFHMVTRSPESIGNRLRRFHRTYSDRKPTGGSLCRVPGIYPSQAGAIALHVHSRQAQDLAPSQQPTLPGIERMTGHDVDQQALFGPEPILQFRGSPNQLHPLVRIREQCFQQIELGLDELPVGSEDLRCLPPGQVVVLRLLGHADRGTAIRANDPNVGAGDLMATPPGSSEALASCRSAADRGPVGSNVPDDAAYTLVSLGNETEERSE